MHRVATLAATGVLAVAVAPRPTHADHPRHSWQFGADARRDGYAMLRAGGMTLAGPASSGGYFGLEFGRSADWFDGGFSIDWFHRSSRDVDLLFETDHGFDPPIRGAVTRAQSSTDFVPLGLTLRVRLAPANAGLVPFVSGTVAYEILHMSFYDRDPVMRPYDALLGDSQTLMGFGWQVVGGIQWALASNAGLFGEAGVHWSDPSGRIDAGVSPVELSASLHGAFLRAGLRLSM